MKQIFTFFILFTALQTNLHAQTFTLTVNNGYGSGVYHAGDVVDIWAKTFPADSVYDQWTGDIANVAMPNEWHTTLTMPAANVSVSAGFKAGGPYTLQFDTIPGQLITKPVYYYFPTAYTGVIYFFHGTGGSAANLVNSVESRQMINQAIAEGFAIIVTEADESTTGIDANADGKLRWLISPIDSVANSDYANIKIITDTLINRGLLNTAAPRYSIGMSNGGNFSHSCSYLYSYRAGISYCSQGVSQLFNIATVPFAFRMALYDNNDNVGPTGNANALANSNTLAGRGICTDYHIHDRSPVYTERFQRIPGVSHSVAQNIWGNLTTNQILDSLSYVVVDPDTILAMYTNNPGLFPSLNPLNATQKAEVLNQLSACYAAHQFYSDYNHLSLTFLRELCDSSTAVSEIQNKDFLVFPNPSSSVINIYGSLNSLQLNLFDLSGRLLLSGITGNQIDISSLAAGTYILWISDGKKRKCTKVIKL